MRTSLIASVVVLSMVAGVMGCGSSQDTASTRMTSGEGGGRTSTPGDSTGIGAPSGGGGGDGTSSSGGTSGGGTGTVKAGTLTAGTWDDNQNFDFYSAYLAKTEPTLAGAPKIPRSDRMQIFVKNGEGSPVAGAQILVSAGSAVYLNTVTGADGRALFFPTFSGVPTSTLSITAKTASGTNTVTAKSGDAFANLEIKADAAAKPKAIDIALMIDTTGSMGDEIRYLSTELDAIAGMVKAKFGDVDQRWALVAYKDAGDSYVVKTIDFRGDVEAFRKDLMTLSADGGGDYPEAPDQALAATMALTWRGGATARMAFWIADAPHHLGRESVVIDALKVAQSKGVHVYPIASSGADELTEFTMRTSAQLTGGRYLFLTDDSGVGGSHLEPKIPCYFVTKLDQAMTRMINIELTGAYLEPATTEILRTGGDPKAGRCTLGNGSQVGIY